jgi:hypothetical protein
MRVWLHFLLAVCVACSGLALPAHACAHGAQASTTADDEAAHEHCGGHSESPPEAPAAPVASVDTVVTGGADGCFDCCGTGQCGCPCATLAALPTPLSTVAPAPAPQGPVIAHATAVPPKATAPPLRPPIS